LVECCFGGEVHIFAEPFDVLSILHQREPFARAFKFIFVRATAWDVDGIAMLRVQCNWNKTEAEGTDRSRDIITVEHRDGVKNISCSSRRSNLILFPTLSVLCLWKSFVGLYLRMLLCLLCHQV
jgi:hypothetical protein